MIVYTPTEGTIGYALHKRCTPSGRTLYSLRSQVQTGDEIGSSEQFNRPQVRAVLIFLCHNDNISRVWIIINQGFFHRKSEEKKELMMKRYCKEDFIRIRDFLADTYAYFERPHNWTIERWNFSISMARVMNGVSLEAWESQIGIWEDGDKILGVVNAEGEDDGEAFFQVAHEDLPRDILTEMFSFCEAHLGKEREGRRVIHLRIPPGSLQIEEIAMSRNYLQRPEKEEVSELCMEQEFRVNLPKGFSFKYGDEVSPNEKGQAHARAFGYYENIKYRERAPIGYQLMSLTPDYRADLDIYVASPDNEIAAFATMWYDEVNHIGMLEPVGTIPEYRRMGLGRASIVQLVTQAQEKRVRRVYVGSGQDFYRRLGFEPKALYGVWVKSIPER